MKGLNVSKKRLDTDRLQLFIANVSLKGIEELDMSYNWLENGIEIDPKRVNDLHKLRLAHCKLYQAPQFVSRLDYIVSLDLSYNRLVSLDEIQFIQLNCLKKLKLQGNRINRLPGSIASLRQLEELVIGDDLAGNCIECIPEQIGSLENLQIFSASRNRIRSVPESLFSLKSLLAVNLSRNFIEDIPLILNESVSLEYLDISFNIIVRIKPDLKLPFQLKELDLSGNKIECVPDIKGIEKINLAGNDCFFEPKVPIGLVTSCNNLSLTDLTINNVINSGVAGGLPCLLARKLTCKPSMACSRCPYRLQVPYGDVVSRGRINGHANVPIVSPICSAACALDVHFRKLQNGAIVLDPSSLCDIEDMVL